MSHLPARALRLAALACSVTIAGPAAAQDIGKCQIYTVVRGDTLSGIAKRADVDGGYQLLFSANSDVISTPDLIEVGQELRIPCEDGSLPARGEAVTEAAPETAEPAPSGLPPIRFLTSGDYAPFVDQELPGQGLFTELVEAAMRLGAPEQEYEIVFAPTWEEHLTKLLPSGEYDMGFAWFLPDCSKVENLEPGNALRCNDYNTTDPFFEAVVSFYTLNGSKFENATAAPQLLGARLCRPSAWFSFDLEAERLVEPNVTMLRPTTQVECWEALLAGKVDVVTFEALPAEADIAMLDLEDRVTVIDELSSLATIHVFTPKSNPNGAAYVEILNAGLAELRSNGQWFELVSRRLAEHEARSNN